MSRDPAKSRPLSENVKRMMWLERAAPRNQNILNAQRVWTENDTIYCQKQGKEYYAVKRILAEMQNCLKRTMSGSVFDALY